LLPLCCPRPRAAGAYAFWHHTSTGDERFGHVRHDDANLLDGRKPDNVMADDPPEPVQIHLCGRRHDCHDEAVALLVDEHLGGALA
jgi:hypothetical protein